MEEYDYKSLGRGSIAAQEPTPRESSGALASSAINIYASPGGARRGRRAIRRLTGLLVALFLFIMGFVWAA